MNKGYWIALYKKIENTNNLSDYAKKATETIIKCGGKPLVRGGKYNILEGENFLYNLATNSSGGKYFFL